MKFKRFFPATRVHCCTGLLAIFFGGHSLAHGQASPPKANTTPPEDKITISLPADLYALKGRTFQIFFRGCIDAVNYLNYDILIKCPIGNKYNRYYEATPDTIGDYPFVISVRDNAKNVLASKTVTLHVIPEPVSPKEKKNILCVGASATDTAHWPAELKRMLTTSGGNPSGLALSNIAFVGRKSKTVPAGQVNYEATGGWTWNTYINKGVKAIRLHVTEASGLQIDDTYKLDDPSNGTMYLSIAEINVTGGVGNIRCIYRYDSPSNATPSLSKGTLTRTRGTGLQALHFNQVEEESFSPFYRNGKVDFRPYVNDYCGGRVDILITHMGVNSALWESSNILEITSEARKFLDGFFSNFPNSIVILSAIPVPPQDGGLGHLYTTAGTINQYGALLKFQEYNRALESLTKEKAYAGRVFFAAANSQIDSENVFPKTSKPVNSRTAETEIVGENPTHPNMNGSYMISDSILRTLGACLNHL